MQILYLMLSASCRVAMEDIIKISKDNLNLCHFMPPRCCYLSPPDVSLFSFGFISSQVG